jgi:hypothetical protein
MPPIFSRVDWLEIGNDAHYEIADRTNGGSFAAKAATLLPGLRSPSDDGFAVGILSATLFPQAQQSS